MFLKSLLNRILSFLRPALLIGGLGDILALWRSAEAKEKGILLLVFAPMFLCIGGLLFSVAHFVLFVLPSFVLGFLGWGLLATLFGAGGNYCYRHLAGKNSWQNPASSRSSRSSQQTGQTGYDYEVTYTDVKFTENPDRGEKEKSEKNEETPGARWFEKVRGKKGRTK